MATDGWSSLKLLHDLFTPMTSAQLKELSGEHASCLPLQVQSKLVHEKYHQIFHTPILQPVLLVPRQCPAAGFVSIADVLRTPLGYEPVNQRMGITSTDTAGRSGIRVGKYPVLDMAASWSSTFMPQLENVAIAKAPPSTCISAKKGSILCEPHVLCICGTQWSHGCPGGGRQTVTTF